jgi:hypothetical protein
MKYLILLLALTGCATQEVKVPIPVACKTEEPKVPAYTFETLSKDDTLFNKVKSLLSDRELALAYEIELRAALQSCK